MYRIMTFHSNGMPTTLVNTKFETKEAAEIKMNELKKVYNVPMMVRKVK